jgi:hypothetical protein
MSFINTGLQAGEVCHDGHQPFQRLTLFWEAVETACLFELRDAPA